MELNQISNKSSWGKSTSDLNDNFSKISADMEKVKNATTKNKGYFSSAEALRESYKAAYEGDKAYVGESFPYSIYVWDVELNDWKDSGKQLTDESVNLGNYYTKDESDTRYSSYSVESEDIEKADETLMTQALRKVAQTLTEAEKSAARSNIDVPSNAQLFSVSSTLNNKISSETSRATSAESKLQSNIDTEASRAKDAEQSLKNNISSNKYGFNATVNGLTTGVHTLASAIKSVPSAQRMLGQKITFDTGAGWVTYQFANLALSEYEKESEWKQVFGIEQVDGDINITNKADEEDITSSADGVLRLADKEHVADSFSGLGRQYLRKNIQTVTNEAGESVKINQLTQDMLSWGSTRYIIQYDYDLNGAEITIPEDCVLDFQGGSLSNGSIFFQKNKLIGEVKINNNCTPKGSITNNELFVDWFGADNTNTYDNSAVLNNIVHLVDSCINLNVGGYDRLGPIIKFSQGRYRFEKPIVSADSDLYYSVFHFEGVGMVGGTNIYYVGEEDTYLFYNWCNFSYSTFKGIFFKGNNINKCFLFKSNYEKSGTQSFNFTDCRWSNFRNAFVSEGDTMTSEVSFINCKFTVFDEDSIIFIFNNLQSVNWRFFGVDIEQTNGIIFQLLQGTYISLYNCSIIPLKGIVIESPADASVGTFWYTNYPQICQYSCRCELRDYSQLLVCKNRADLGFIFQNCSFGGRNIIESEDVYQIELNPDDVQHVKLIFNDCTQFDNYKAKIGKTEDGDSYIHFNRCRGFNINNFISNSYIYNTGYDGGNFIKIYRDNIHFPISQYNAILNKNIPHDYYIGETSVNFINYIESNKSKTFTKNSFMLNRRVGGVTFNIMPNVNIKLEIFDANKTYGTFNIKAWANFDYTIKVGKYITESDNLSIRVTNNSDGSGTVQGLVKIGEMIENHNSIFSGHSSGISLNPNGEVNSSFATYNSTIGIPMWWDGKQSCYRDSQGFRLITKNSYTEEDRPIPYTTDVGLVIFDTTLNKPIWWNGTNWVDATGVTV